jgi:uncharacterized repeat protein (TIGR01451 family)
MLLRKLKIAGLSAVVLGGMMISQADAQTVTNTVSKDKDNTGATFDPYQNSDGNGTTTGADTASAVFTFETASDLAITKTVSAGPYYNDSTYSYTIVATNNGPSDDAGAVIKDTLPAGMVVVGTPTSTDGTAITVTTLGSGRVEVVWNPTGGLANGDSETLTVEFSTVSNTTGTMVNDAFITGNNVDNVAANDSNRAEHTITPSSDVHITKVVSDENGGNYQTGDTIKYTITVSTVGPDRSVNQLINDVLPTEVTYLADAGAYGTSGATNNNASGDANGNGTFTGGASTTWAGDVGYSDAGVTDVITIVIFATINP